MVIIVAGFGEEALGEWAAKMRKWVLDREPLPRVKGWEERKESSKAEMEVRKRWEKHLEPVLAWKSRDGERFQERIIRQKRKNS